MFLDFEIPDWTDAGQPLNWKTKIVKNVSQNTKYENKYLHIFLSIYILM